MGTLETAQSTSIVEHAETRLESDLLAQAFEQLEEDEVELSPETEKCVPFVMVGLMERQFGIDPTIPIHGSIGKVLEQAGLLPPPPSAFE